MSREQRPGSREQGAVARGRGAETRERCPGSRVQGAVAWAGSRSLFTDPGSLRFPLIFLLLALSLFLSCASDPFYASILGKLRLIEGAYYHSQGRYAPAISAYHEASMHQDSAPYGEYGLGVIYLELDEGAAALERYAAASAAVEGMSESEHGELIYRIHYNSGVAYFQAGDYGSAASSFRKALKTDNRRIEAKRNLELSLLSLNQGEPESSSQGEEEPGAKDTPLLFEYVRQKEQDRWKSAEWIEEHYDPGLDY